MSTWAVGDLQGCQDALERLLLAIKFDPGQDRLLLVGDLVNRGGQDLGTLRLLEGLGSCVSAVLGNHDLHLLRCAETGEPPAPTDTFAEVLEAPDAERLLGWLRTRPLLIREAEFAMVHAGLLPEWSWQEATRRARQLEARIQSKQLAPLLDLEASTRPYETLDSELQRERLALDAFVTLRALDPQGGILRGFSAGPEQLPEGCSPWFERPHRRQTKLRLLCGHWAALGVQLGEEVWCLDGACVWGRTLCAVSVPDGVRVEVPGLGGLQGSLAPNTPPAKQA